MSSGHVQFDLLGPSWMDSIVSTAKNDSRAKPYEAAVEHEEYQKAACEKKKVGGPDRFTVPAFECGAGSTS
jgi:hypothetical protein